MDPINKKTLYVSIYIYQHHGSVMGYDLAFVSIRSHISHHGIYLHPIGWVSIIPIGYPYDINRPYISPSGLTICQEECHQQTTKACDADDPETGLWQRGVALPNEKPPESWRGIRHGALGSWDVRRFFLSFCYMLWWTNIAMENHHF